MMSWLGHKNESNGGVYKDFEVKDIVFRCICIQLLDELPCDRIHYQRCSNRLVNERWRDTDALSRWRGKFKVENEGQVGSGKSSERDLCPCNLTNSSESCWNSLLGLSLEIVSFFALLFWCSPWRQEARMTLLKKELRVKYTESFLLAAPLPSQFFLVYILPQFVVEINSFCSFSLSKKVFAATVNMSSEDYSTDSSGKSPFC